MGLFSPVIREYLKEYNEHAYGCALDVGCGDKPYRKIFPKISKYIGIDQLIEPQNYSEHHEKRRAATDIRGRAEVLPFKAARFDTILSFQVIEHLAEPLLFFQEAHRVLKPGGKIILTFPLINPVHETPYDFFRYTVFGVKHLCLKTNLRVVESTPMGGGWLSVGYLMHSILSKEACTMESKYGRIWRNYLSPRIYSWSKSLDSKCQHPEYTLNYLLIAMKPME